eukprot:Rhum_TRINITY_DN14469_c2_g2::Rhum_TRINITY_DN14469_c2_g2_i1::g.90330::m.90330
MAGAPPHPLHHQWRQGFPNYPPAYAHLGPAFSHHRAQHPGFPGPQLPPPKEGGDKKSLADLVDEADAAGHTPAGASGELWAKAQHFLTSYHGTMHEIAEADKKVAAPADAAPEDSGAMEAIAELRETVKRMEEDASEAAADLEAKCIDEAAATARSFAEQGLGDVHESLRRVEEEVAALRDEASKQNAQLRQEVEAASARNAETERKLARLERALQGAEERWKADAAWRAMGATVAAAAPAPTPTPALRCGRDDSTDTWSIPVLADSSCSQSLASDGGAARLVWPEAATQGAEAGPEGGFWETPDDRLFFADDTNPEPPADSVVLTDPHDGYEYPPLHMNGAKLLRALWDGALAESMRTDVELWAEEVRAAPRSRALPRQLYDPPFDFSQQHAEEHQHSGGAAPQTPQKGAGGAAAATPPPAAKTQPAAAEAAPSPKAQDPAQAAAPDAGRAAAAAKPKEKKEFTAATDAPPLPEDLVGSSPSRDDAPVAAKKETPSASTSAATPGLDANRRVTTVDAAVTAAGKLLKGNDWFVGIRLSAADKRFGLREEVDNRLVLEGAGPAYYAGVRGGMTVLAVADMGTSRYYCLKVDECDNLQGTFKRDAASDGRNCGKIHLPYSLFVKNLYTQTVWDYPTLLVSMNEGQGLMNGGIVDTGVRPFSTETMTFANAEDVQVAPEPLDEPTVWHYRGSPAAPSVEVSSAAKAPVPAASVAAEKVPLQPVDVRKGGQQSLAAATEQAKKALQARSGELAAMLEVVSLAEFKLSKTPTQTIVSDVEKGSEAQERGLQKGMLVLSWHAGTASTCTLCVLLGDCALQGVCKTLNTHKVVEFKKARLLAKRTTDSAGFAETTTAMIASTSKGVWKDKDVVCASVVTKPSTDMKRFYINVASSRTTKEWLRFRVAKQGLKTANGAVTAVEPKSEAWKEGLREGMKVLSRKDEKGDGGKVRLVVEPRA